jgi:hypothetical protein
MHLTDADLLDELLAGARRDSRREEEAWLLPKAARFSDDPLLKSESYFIEQLKACPEIWEPLRQATTDQAELEREEHGHASTVGASRMDGDIAPILCAWLISAKPEMQFFHGNRIDSEIWQLGDWERVPCYGVFRNRVIEAEELFVSAFEEAARRCWQIVFANDPHAGRHWHIDGTAYESHVQLHHACSDHEACMANGGKNMPKVIERAGIEQVDAAKHAEQAEAPAGEEAADDEKIVAELSEEAIMAALFADDDDDDDLEELALDEAFPEAKHPKYRPKHPALPPFEPLQKEILIGSKGKKNGDKDAYHHRYVCRDRDAGFRIFQSASGQKYRQWVGGYALTITDDYTDALIGQFHIPADSPEHKAYLDVLALGKRVTGVLPENMICDRGFNVRSVRRVNAILGIGQVSPFRKPNGSVTKRALMRRDEYDEYGIPTCHYCGSPGTSVGRKLGWERRNGKPVIRFRCTNPHTDQCRTAIQRIDCELEYLLLGVLSRECPLYFELRNQGRPQENAHQNARARYCLAGKNVTSRCKRIGIPFMALRAAVASFVEVFRLCLRHGWIGNHKKLNLAAPVRRKGGDRGVRALKRLRARAGLLLPRGKKALDLIWDGVVPDGYKTIAQRRAEKKKAAEQAKKNKGSPAPVAA